MAVVIQGVGAVDADQDGYGDRTYRVSYQSRASLPPTVDNENVVSAAVGIATGFAIGSTWTNDPFAYCKSIKSRCTNRHDKAAVSWRWETAYEFSSKIDSQNQPQGPTAEKNPTLRPARVSITVDKWEFPTTTVAGGGGQVKNSAGDLVIRMKKRSRVIFRFSRFLSGWNWEWTQEAPNGFMYSMNQVDWVPSGPYTGLLGDTPVAANLARIEDIKVDVSAENGGCVQVDIEIHVDLEGFNEKFFDQGFFFLNAAGVYTPGGGAPPATARRRFTDRHGFATQPQLLDGAGGPLAFGAAPVVNSFNLYSVRDWSVYPLGGPGGYFS